MVFVGKHCADVINLLVPGEDALLLYYPKIPILGRSELPAALVFALIGYGLLAIKKRWTGQQVVALILDLPVEMQVLVSEKRPMTLDALARGQTLTWPQQLVNVVERLVFELADVLVSPSCDETDYLVQKHGLRRSKFVLERRHTYLPDYGRTLPAVQLNGENGLRVFYSGNLALPEVKETIGALLDLYGEAPASHFYLCGHGGQWIHDEVACKGLANVHYLGVLDHATHDAVAQACNVGLLLYDSAYYDMAAPAKYSAYVANGLAILSTDRSTLATFVREDGVGEAVAPAQVRSTLARWLRHPEQVAVYIEQAGQLRGKFTNGGYFQEWWDVVFPIAG
jgi:hypothetical protein